MTLSEPQTGFDSWAQNVGQLRDLQRLADAEKGPETTIVKKAINICAHGQNNMEFR